MLGLRLLSVLLPWLLAWLRRQWLSWLLLLLVRPMLLAADVLSLCLSVIGFGPCTLDLNLSSVGEPQTMWNHPRSRWSSSGSVGTRTAELDA